LFSILNFMSSSDLCNTFQQWFFIFELFDVRCFLLIGFVRFFEWFWFFFWLIFRCIFVRMGFLTNFLRSYRFIEHISVALVGTFLNDALFVLMICTSFLVNFWMIYDDIFIWIGFLTIFRFLCWLTVSNFIEDLDLNWFFRFCILNLGNCEDLFYRFGRFLWLILFNTFLNIGSLMFGVSYFFHSMLSPCGMILASFL
jgi:hypothetical protein